MSFPTSLDVELSCDSINEIWPVLSESQSPQAPCRSDRTLSWTSEGIYHTRGQEVAGNIIGEMGQHTKTVQYCKLYTYKERFIKQNMILIIVSGHQIFKINMPPYYLGGIIGRRKKDFCKSID